MPWLFLHPDDRQTLTGGLSGLGLIQESSTSRAMLLTAAGLAHLNHDLASLAGGSARAFAVELISALENEDTLPDKPAQQALGALLDYILRQGDTPVDTGRLCARLIARYRLIEDGDLLARLERDYGPTGEVTPWREIKWQVEIGRGGFETRPYTSPPPPDPGGPLPEPGILPPGSRMPFGRNPLFTGREDDLRALAETLLPVAN